MGDGLWLGGCAVAATAEKGRRRGEGAESWQPGEDEQAHARGCDLRGRAEADHRPGEADIGSKEDSRQRYV